MSVSTDRVMLRGLRVFAHHGVLEHEKELGQMFVIDLDLGLDLSTAGASDRLEDTVDYGRITGDVAALVAGGRRQLIEAVAEDVAACALRHERVESVRVRVAKPRAPLPADAEVAVEITRRRAEGESVMP